MTTTTDPVTMVAAEIEAWCSDLGGISPGLARSLAELAARILAGKVTPVMAGELPLRIVKLAHGYTVRALCGAESGVVFASTADAAVPVARAARALAVRNQPVSGSVSPVAVLKLAAHAETCARCQARQATIAGVAP